MEQQFAELTFARKGWLGLKISRIVALVVLPTTSLFLSANNDPEKTEICSNWESPNSFLFEHVLFELLSPFFFFFSSGGVVITVAVELNLEGPRRTTLLAGLIRSNMALDGKKEATAAAAAGGHFDNLCMNEQRPKKAKWFQKIILRRKNKTKQQRLRKKAASRWESRLSKTGDGNWNKFAKHEFHFLNLCCLVFKEHVLYLASRAESCKASWNHPWKLWKNSQEKTLVWDLNCTRLAEFHS